MTRRMSVCLSVRDAIKEAHRSRAKGSHYNDDQGRPLTRLEAIDALMNELAKGHEVIPLGSECGNPCKNPGCAGFDYSGGGCPGYEVESLTAADSPTPADSQKGN
jgi:hypothetical protein